MNRNCGIAVSAGVALSVLFAVSPARGTEGPMIQEVSPVVMEKPQDSLVLFGAPPWDADALAAMRLHQLTVSGKPAENQEPPPNGLFSGGVTIVGTPAGAPEVCEWIMPTPQAGNYVVSLFLVSGEKRSGSFGFYSGATKVASDEFRQDGPVSGCVKAFRITTPPGQNVTRMFLAGAGIALWRVDLSSVTRPVENPDGVIRRLAESSYRTVIRPAAGQNAPASVILAPGEGSEARLARELADTLKLRLAEESEPSVPFPQNPALGVAGTDTNLILLSAGTGGPVVQAMRRAGLIAEDVAIPGAGGYAIRTVPRPFNGKANVIVISGGDEAGLAEAVKAFQPKLDAKTGELVWDRFLVESPGKRWAQLRPAYYRYADNDPYWQREIARLEPPFNTRGVPSRAYIVLTAEVGDQYWRTGNNRFSDLFKRLIFKMEDENIYAPIQGSDSHMELYNLIRAWSRVEEAPVFTTSDRLRITNFLLHHCVLGPEGFPHACVGSAHYSGAVRMRHNHQTILGCGMMQAYLYFGRLYGLGSADIWKSWCDGLISEASFWGHGPENSFHYEPKMFREVADMLHFQGLRAAGRECSRTWPAVAARIMSARGSLGVPACYGDCGDGTDYQTMDPDRFDLFGAVMRDDLAWPPAQFAIDQMIRGYRYAAPSSPAAGELFAYLNGSTNVGGVRPPSPPAAVPLLKQLTGLVAIPMTEGYWRYMTGQVGSYDFWAHHRRPEIIPYPKTADKVIYRTGWNLADEYMMLETLGWAEHGHMELGAIVQYCQGGRLWVVEQGYNNCGPEHCSTLEVKRDGKPAWDHFEGQHGRFFDFRTGPQMFEIVQFDRPAVTDAIESKGAFTVVCRADDLAGATWLRSVSGGDNKGLHLSDSLTAQEPGEYQIVFRLRLLGRVEGDQGKWQVFQKGAVLPISLAFQEGDSAVVVPAVPDTHGSYLYSWYPFVQGVAKLALGGPALAEKSKRPGEQPAAAPRTIEWKRLIRLSPGQNTVLRATLGPSEKVN